MTVTINGSAGVTTNTGAVYDGLKQDTVRNTNSGTFIDVSSIPSWVKRITITLVDISTSGTTGINLRLGTSASFLATGYTQSRSSFGATTLTTASSDTVGFFITNNGDAAALVSGTITLTLSHYNIWICSGNLAMPSLTRLAIFTGYVALSDVLTRIRFITGNGTDTFDSGAFNVIYE